MYIIFDCRKSFTIYSRQYIVDITKYYLLPNKQHAFSLISSMEIGENYLFIFHLNMRKKKFKQFMIVPRFRKSHSPECYSLEQQLSLIEEYKDKTNIKRLKN